MCAFCTHQTSSEKSTSFSGGVEKLFPEKHQYEFKICCRNLVRLNFVSCRSGFGFRFGLPSALFWSRTLSLLAKIAHCSVLGVVHGFCPLYSVNYSHFPVSYFHVSAQSFTFLYCINNNYREQQWAWHTSTSQAYFSLKLFCSVFILFSCSSYILL